MCERRRGFRSGAGFGEIREMNVAIKVWVETSTVRYNAAPSARITRMSSSIINDGAPTRLMNEKEGAGIAVSN